MGGRRVAYVTLERTDSGVALFQAVIGATVPYLARDPESRFPGLPPPPEATWIEREGGDPGALRALATSYAGYFSLDLLEAPWGRLDALESELRELARTRGWLRARGNSIEGGTSEVQLNIIAKHVLGLPD